MIACDEPSAPHILVTGGSGFIGRTLVKKLVARGTSVIVYDIVPFPDPEPINSRVKYLSGDIRDTRTLEMIFREFRIEGVIHLAAVSRVITAQNDPELCWDVNVNGTRSLLDAITTSPQKPWIIMGSSREVYGEPEILPVPESYGFHPINIYGEAKVAGERLVREYAETHGLNSVVLRFSNVYGARYDILDRVIPRFILKALQDETLEIHGGGQIFDFTHVDDTTHGILLAVAYLQKQMNSGSFDDFHILTGTPHSLQDVAAMIEMALNKPLNTVYTGPRNYDVVRFFGDPSKAYANLGFQASIPLEVGIQKTVELFQEEEI